MMSIRRIASGIRANRLGSVAFEFALVSPLLFSILLGTLEFGFVLFSFSSMQLGTDIAARGISVNTAVGTNAQAEAAVRAALPSWLRSSVTVTVSQTDLADPRKNLIRVRATADAEDATPLPMFTRAVPWTMSTEVAVVQELPF